MGFRARGGLQASRLKSLLTQRQGVNRFFKAGSTLIK